MLDDEQFDTISRVGDVSPDTSREPEKPRHSPCRGFASIQGPKLWWCEFQPEKLWLISPRRPVATIARGEWKVIVVLTYAALIDRIASDC